MTIQELIKHYHNRLSPLDAEILLSYVLKKPKEYIISRPQARLTSPQIKKLKLLINKRLNDEPIAYLVKKKEFYGLDFHVDKNTLIPRPETELLVSEILRKIQNTKYKIQNTTLVDVGTGSGNIIISVAKNIPKASRANIKLFGLDISKKSLNVARKNSRIHGTHKKIKFIPSDLLAYFRKQGPAKSRMIIVANLPYVSPALYNQYRDGLKYEPKSALISSRKGLGHYTRLLRQIDRFILIANYELPITAIFEISPEQKKPILGLIKGRFPEAQVRFLKDLAGRWRIVEIQIYPPKFSRDRILADN